MRTSRLNHLEVYMIEMLLGVAVAIVILVVAYVAFAYGLKCGQKMKDIPNLIEPKGTDRVEKPIGNPFD